jgi:hypothetical protein
MKKAFLNKNKQINKYYLKYCEMRCWELGICVQYIFKHILLCRRSQDSSMSIVTRLRASCPGIDSRQEEESFLLATHPTHPGSYPVGTGSSLPRR